MPPPMYKPQSVSSRVSMSPVASAKRATPSANTTPPSAPASQPKAYPPLRKFDDAPTGAVSPATTPTAQTSVSDKPFFEVYHAPSAGLGWRWNFWGSTLIATMQGRNKATREEAEADLAAFKKLVSTSPTRNK